MSISETLTVQHRACDRELAQVERLAHRGDWPGARLAAQDFIRRTEDHFRLEEDVLFPRLEEAVPMAAAPTQVMRSEHTHIREVCRDLSTAVEAADSGGLADAVDTLLLLIQQHNAKEEAILYPLADRALDAGLLDGPMQSREAGAHWNG